MASKRINRREIAASFVGTDYAEMDPYQPGRHRPPVYDDGTGPVCVTLPGERPPAGWQWAKRPFHDDRVTVWAGVSA